MEIVKTNNAELLALKVAALENATSYPEYKEIADMVVIEVPCFEYDTIRNQINENESLTRIDAEKLDLVLEIVQLISDHHFRVFSHDYICFCWRGFPILAILIKNDKIKYPSSRMIYVSLKVYKDELANLVAEKSIVRIMTGTFIGLILVAGIFIGYNLYEEIVH